MTAAVELVPEARLTLHREALARRLSTDATGALDVSTAAVVGKWAALPALVLRPGNPWITRGQSAPPQSARLALDVELYVSQANVDTALDDLESLVETVLLRLPIDWRFDHGGTPSFLNVSDHATLTAAITVSRPYSLT